VGCLVERDGDEVTVVLDASRRTGKQLLLPLAAVLSVAPKPTRAVAETFVRAIVPTDDGEVRVWHYGAIKVVAPGGELATVAFDDGTRSTICVYDLQDARTNLWVA